MTRNPYWRWTEGGRTVGETYILEDDGTPRHCGYCDRLTIYKVCGVCWDHILRLPDIRRAKDVYESEWKMRLATYTSAYRGV